MGGDSCICEEDYIAGAFSSRAQSWQHSRRACSRVGEGAAWGDSMWSKKSPEGQIWRPEVPHHCYIFIFNNNNNKTALYLS